jgi:hypothetical protein
MSWPVAAREAQTRAIQCQLRRAELTEGRPVQLRDVERARQALERAQQRTQRARGRLAELRRRTGARGSTPAEAVLYVNEPALRTRTKEIGPAAVYPSYLGLGGHCSELELDAFAHGLAGLPVFELHVLSQAVWEITEL